MSWSCWYYMNWCCFTYLTLSLSLSLSFSLSRTAVQEGGFSGKLDELEQATSFLHDNGTHTQLSVWLWRRFAWSSLLSPLSLSQVSCSTMMTVSWTIFTLSIPSGSAPSWLMWSQCKRETHFKRTVRNVKMTTSVYQNSHTYFWSDHTHFYAGVQKYSTQDAVDRKILSLKYFHRGTGATKVKCPRINIHLYALHYETVKWQNIFTAKISQSTVIQYQSEHLLNNPPT